ncbi:LPXTG cell wall anchor domain-containing protein, partial [Vibrio sp. FNV 38]|nr:LPXTG cell wall anchor domain-containing protein [Vibrio sp. FNV 38]
LEDSTFTVDETVYTNDNLKQDATVKNQAGAELPSTGGIGTTIFYVIGGLLIIGAAVVLVARRKAQE